jgi:hypothetical protein
MRTTNPERGGPHTGQMPKTPADSSGHSRALDARRPARPSVLTSAVMAPPIFQVGDTRAAGANEGSHSLQTPPDKLRPHLTFAVVNGSPPDSTGPAQTPCPCLGVKGLAGATEGRGDADHARFCEQQPEQQRHHTASYEHVRARPRHPCSARRAGRSQTASTVGELVS